MKKILILPAMLVVLTHTHAQMPDDGFTMKKGELCLVAGYEQSAWKEYWEGTRLRQNENVGMFTSKAFMPMAGFGITDKLIVFASLPYINNSSSAGYMEGKKGWQDVSASAKYQLLQKQSKALLFRLFGTAGFSLPVTHYPPDFLPFSIGIGSKTAQARLIAHTVVNNHFFTTLQAGYIARANIKVDRITYYTDKQYYSNEMRIPDMVEGSVQAGYTSNRFRADVHYRTAQSTSGSDIRLNDMPYPGNKMNMQMAGVYGLLWVPGVNGLGIGVTADKVFAGRNVGKAFMWMADVQYVFTPFKKK